MGETTQGRTGKWAKQPGGETTRGERESGRRLRGERESGRNDPDSLGGDVFGFFSSVRYWYGAVHICSNIDRFIMSEGSDPLSLPFTSKTGQPHSVALKGQAFFFTSMF